MWSSVNVLAIGKKMVKKNLFLILTHWLARISCSPTLTVNVLAHFRAARFYIKVPGFHSNGTHMCLQYTCLLLKIAIDPNNEVNRQ